MKKVLLLHFFCVLLFGEREQPGLGIYKWFTDAYDDSLNVAYLAS